MKWWQRTGVILCVALLCMVAIQAAYSTPVENEGRNLEAEIDAFVAERMEAMNIPGAAIGMVLEDRAVYTQGYGTGGGGLPVTPQTPFMLASISKSFTALGIMQLVEAGKLDLATEVKDILPWFQVKGDGDAVITIQHLLYQTSGLSENEGYLRNLEANTPDSLETSIRRLSSQSLVSKPGTKFEYSNTNYDILGLIIETVSGQGYEEYLRENIYAPLQMVNSHTSLEDGRAQGMSSGYYPFLGFPVVIDGMMPYTRAILPSAGLVSNADDMTHYLSAHLNGGEYLGVQILSGQGIEMLHTPGAEISPGVGYGMGWVSFTWEEIAAAEPIPQGLTHSGSWLGFAANMVIVPERQLGVIVLLNSNDPLRESVYANIGFDLARIVIGLDALNKPASEDFLTRNRRAAGLGVILLLVGANLWLRRIRCSSRARLANNIVYAIELVIAGAVGFYFAQPIPLTVRFSPDMALVHLMIILIAVVWGSIRTLSVYRSSYGKQE